MSKVPHVPTETKASVVINTQICKKKKKNVQYKKCHIFWNFSINWKEELFTWLKGGKKFSIVKTFLVLVEMIKKSDPKKSKVYTLKILFLTKLAQ